MAALVLPEAVKQVATVPFIPRKTHILQYAPTNGGIGELASGASDSQQIGQIQQAPDTPLQPVGLVLCLKKIRKSIDFWTKERGRQGYLNFVAEYSLD